jgi:hypothetical protein
MKRLLAIILLIVGIGPAHGMQQKITLQSGDHSEFEIDEKLAIKALTIKKLLKDLATDEAIPLPIISGNTLQTVIDYLKHKYEHNNPEKAYANIAQLSSDESMDFITAIIYLDLDAQEILAKIPAIRWLLERPTQCRTIASHELFVNAVVINPNNSCIVTASGDGLACTWNAQTERLIAAFTQHQACIYARTLSPDSSCVVSAADDNTIYVRNIKTGEVIYSLPWQTNTIGSLAISYDNSLIVAGLNDGTVCTWNTRTGQFLSTSTKQTSPVSAVAVSRNNLFIISGSWDNTACIWNAQTGELIHRLAGHTRPIDAVAISHDNSITVTASADSTACIWNTQTGKLMNKLTGHAGAIRAVTISSDNSLIITGSYDNTARIWDTKTGSLLLTLTGPSSPIRSVAISSDNSFIVAGLYDGTTFIWHLTATMRQLECIALEGILFIIQVHKLAAQRKQLNMANAQKDATHRKLQATFNSLPANIHAALIPFVRQPDQHNGWSCALM